MEAPFPNKFKNGVVPRLAIPHVILLPSFLRVLYRPPIHTCRHCTAVGLLLGSQAHMAVIRSIASGQAWGMILLSAVGANCQGGVGGGSRHHCSWVFVGIHISLSSHLWKPKVHCLCELEPLGPVLLRWRSHHTTNLVDLISLKPWSSVISLSS